MKILLVGMSHSVHTARWIQQLADTGWDVHLFPSLDRGEVHPLMANVTVHHSIYAPSQIQGSNVHSTGFPVYTRRLASLGRTLLQRYLPSYRKNQLVKLIAKLRPDVVHSLAIQSSGHLTLQAKKEYKGVFPPWLVSNWGSDLYFFGRLNEFKDKAAAVLSECDHYSCECERDKALAVSDYGFRGSVHPFIQAGGGWDLKGLESLRSKLAPSKRRIILLKGYQGTMGRAQVGLRALERCKDLLTGYEIVMFGAINEQEMKRLAEWFSYNTGIQARVLPRTNKYEEILDLQAQARIFMGLSITDGVSNSFLEAMVMGAFPIQSLSSSPEEWIQDGVSGAIVPAEDPEIIEKALRKALTDDTLVDKASELNWQTAGDRLERGLVKEKAIAMYENIAASGAKSS